MVLCDLSNLVIIKGVDIHFVIIKGVDIHFVIFRGDRELRKLSDKITVLIMGGHIHFVIFRGDTELRKLSDKIVHLSSEIGVSFKRWVIVVFWDKIPVLVKINFNFFFV